MSEAEAYGVTRSRRIVLATGISLAAAGSGRNDTRCNHCPLH